MYFVRLLQRIPHLQYRIYSGFMFVHITGNGVWAAVQLFCNLEKTARLIIKLSHLFLFLLVGVLFAAIISG